MGVEVVQQAALAAVADDLVVDVQELLRGQHLHLEGGLVGDAVGAGEGVAALAAQAPAEEAALLRQGLLAGGGHLGEVDAGVVPGDDMAGAGDAYRQVVVLAADFAHGEDVEQLGVQRAPVELEDEVADRRSDNWHTHDTAAHE